MNRIVKKALRKVRGQHEKPKKLEPKWRKYESRRKANQLRQASWERDKSIKRAQNFKKALVGLERYRQARQAEKDRQQIIKSVRIENLKKARKARGKTT